MTPQLRAAGPTDAGQTGEILWQFRGRAVAAAELFSAAEAIAECGHMIDRDWVTVAQDDEGRILGFIARDGERIHALYVARRAAGQGVGKALLDHAKTRTDRLTLSTGAANRAARKFYRREAFVETPPAAATPEAEIHLHWHRETQP